MIDENKTMLEYGYVSSSIAKQSKKLIVAVCDDCEKQRNVPKYAYRKLCPSCASIKSWSCLEKREKRSILYKGEKNPFFGKSHTNESKNKISNSKLGQNMSNLPGESAKKKVIQRYKRSAKYRGLYFLLTTKEISDLFKKKCYYCGSPPSNNCKHGKGNGSFVYSGVDRKDNKIGYISKNCVPCCDICNKAKRNLDYQDFIDWIYRISDYNLERELS